MSLTGVWDRAIWAVGFGRSCSWFKHGVFSVRVPRNGPRSVMKLQVRLRGEVLENWAFAFAEITHGPSTNFIGFRGPVGGDLGDSTRGPRQVDDVT